MNKKREARLFELEKQAKQNYLTHGGFIVKENLDDDEAEEYAILFNEWLKAGTNE